MHKNIIRLATLLEKDTLTTNERREALHLAQAMFGTTARVHMDSVVISLRRKKIISVNDPAGLLSKPATNVTHGVVNQHKQYDEGTFKVDDVTYSAHKDSADRPYFTGNGKRVGKAIYLQAKAKYEANSEES